MRSDKVSPKRIDDLINNSHAMVRCTFGKCTVVEMQLENGFVLTESSGCVSPENYDQEIGKKICYERIENRLWELEGYALQKEVYEREHGQYAKIPVGTFGWAIERMKYGDKMRRRGWNGKGIYIELQLPDENSAMTSPYIYIDTTGLRSDNADAPRSCVPWLASQTDMLARDWETVQEE